MSTAISKMLSTPGFYCVSDKEGLQLGSYAVVEILPNGDCHQLDPKGARDGLLSANGWHDDALAFGPFPNHTEAVLP